MQTFGIATREELFAASRATPIACMRKLPEHVDRVTKLSFEETEFSGFHNVARL